jgi:hypothetical protein
MRLQLAAVIDGVWHNGGTAWKLEQSSKVERESEMGTKASARAGESERGLASPFRHRHKGIRWFKAAHVAVATKTRGDGERRASAVWVQRLVSLRSGWPRAQIGTGLHY